MLALRILLAAGSITLINGAPVSSFLPHLTKRGASDILTYVKTFTGTGSTSQGWPALDQWVPSLEEMFSDQANILADSCAQWGVPNNSDQENSDLQNAISSVGASTGVDPRYILAIVLQESNGCVRAPTTNYGVRNPGLMQSHNGAGSCNNGPGAVLTPCPASQINQMIQDGAGGTTDGPGLQQLIAQAGTQDVSKYYIAARLYNSGSNGPGGNLGLDGATNCYASDVANRVVGWAQGDTGCSNAEVGIAPILDALFTGAVHASDPDTSAPVPASPPATTAAAVEPTPTVAPVAAAPTTTSTTTVAVTTTSTVAVSSAAASAPADTISDVSPSVTPPTDSNTTPTGSGTAITAGTACSNEGEWNCIGASSFQQCGSGVWSAVQQVAAGTQCKSGQSAVIDISAVGSKRSLGHLAHAMKHARHVFS